MKINKLLTLLLTAIFTTQLAFGQNNSDDAKALVKQGVELNNQKNYAGAIEKYKAALKLDPESTSAAYQLGFTLFASGKGLDGAPYLEQVIKANTSAALTVSSYDLLGSIYDRAHQPAKAISYFKEGIKLNADNQSLRYNLGLAYFRNKQYPEAEEAAIAAIKLDPKHTGSQRLYALVTFHQNKRVPALMGFCSFLLLEPQGQRAAEAYGNIQNILQGGLLKPDGGYIAKDALTLSLNKVITQVAADMSKRRYASPVALLQAQLNGIFDGVSLLSAKQPAKDFFWNYHADFFGKLSQSTNMQAFARLISASANNGENAKWIEENAKAMEELDAWLKATERGF